MRQTDREGCCLPILGEFCWKAPAALPELGGRRPAQVLTAEPAYRPFRSATLQSKHIYSIATFLALAIMSPDILIRPLARPDADAASALRREAVIEAPHAFLISVDDNLAQDEANVRRALEAGVDSVILGAMNPGLCAMAGLYRVDRIKRRHVLTV